MESAGPAEPATLNELLTLPCERVAQVDLGRANLLCATGLPGAEELDLEACLSQLDAWADQVRGMTEQHLHVFRQNPATFEHSEPLWRLLAMTRMLHEQFGVGYNMDRAFTEPDWTDSQDLLLHGLLGPRRTGTCVSLPVLVVAVGCRLDYPTCLSHAPGHTFSRWDGREHDNPAWRERLNIEFSGNMDVLPDEHYFDFPVRWPQWQREQYRRGDPRCEYLHSFSRAQEIAHSLCQRAVCLEATGKHTEAINTYYAAHRFDGHFRGYLSFAKRALRLKAETVMRSMGLEPTVLRTWLAQAGSIGAAAADPVPVPASQPTPAAQMPAAVPAVLASGRPATRPAASMQTHAAIHVASHGMPPVNVADLARAVLARTCAGTPADPTPDLLLPNPPEPKVDPYASLRDQDGNVRLPQPE